MKKYAFITDKENKKVDVLINEKPDDNIINFYKKNGYKLQEVEKGLDGQWYLIGYAPKNNEKDKLLEELMQKEKETGYFRLVRDLYFNIKKLGGTVNPSVYKKMLEIDTLAKKYRKTLKQNKNLEDLEG